jgi:two-component system response regulator DesR
MGEPAADAVLRPRLRALAGGGGGARSARPLPTYDDLLRQARHDPDRRLRVLVVADEVVVHLGFGVLLGEQGWVERYDVASDAMQAREIARRHRVHVVVITGVTGDDAALELTAALTSDAPDVRVLLMGAAAQVTPSAAQEAGAAGLIARGRGAEDLLMSVRMAGMGLTLFEPAQAPPGDVSEREREIIRLIAAGATNREIGDQMYLSPNTVKQHASALYRKLHARNRAEAVQRAQRLGLIA